MQTFFMVLAAIAALAVLVCFFTHLKGFGDFCYKIGHLLVTGLAIGCTGLLYYYSQGALSHEWALGVFCVCMVVSFVVYAAADGGLLAAFFYTTAWFSFAAALLCLHECAFYKSFISLDSFWWNIAFFFVIIFVGALIAYAVAGFFRCLFNPESWIYPGIGLLMIGLVACFLGVGMAFITDMFEYRPFTAFFVLISLIPGGKAGASSSSVAPPAPISEDERLQQEGYTEDAYWTNEKVKTTDFGGYEGRDQYGNKYSRDSVWDSFHRVDD